MSLPSIPNLSDLIGKAKEISQNPELDVSRVIPDFITKGVNQITQSIHNTLPHTSWTTWKASWDVNLPFLATGLLTSYGIGKKAATQEKRYNPTNAVIDNFVVEGIVKNGIGNVALSSAIGVGIAAISGEVALNLSNLLGGILLTTGLAIGRRMIINRMAPEGVFNNIVSITSGTAVLASYILTLFSTLSPEAAGVAMGTLMLLSAKQSLKLDGLGLSSLLDAGGNIGEAKMWQKLLDSKDTLYTALGAIGGATILNILNLGSAQLFGVFANPTNITLMGAGAGALFSGTNLGKITGSASITAGITNGDPLLTSISGIVSYLYSNGEYINSIDEDKLNTTNIDNLMALLAQIDQPNTDFPTLKTEILKRIPFLTEDDLVHTNLESSDRNHFVNAVIRKLDEYKYRLLNEASMGERQSLEVKYKELPGKDEVIKALDDFGGTIVDDSAQPQFQVQPNNPNFWLHPRLEAKRNLALNSIEEIKDVIIPHIDPSLLLINAFTSSTLSQEAEEYVSKFTNDIENKKWIIPNIDRNNARNEFSHAINPDANDTREWIPHLKEIDGRYLFGLMSRDLQSNMLTEIFAKKIGNQNILRLFIPAFNNVELLQCVSPASYNTIMQQIQNDDVLRGAVFNIISRKNVKIGDTTQLNDYGDFNHRFNRSYQTLKARNDAETRDRGVLGNITHGIVTTLAGLASARFTGMFRGARRAS